MMYNTKYQLVIHSFLLFLSIVESYPQVGIGTTNPDEPSVLELASLSQGVLLPRMTTAQRDVINAPTQGLVIYNLDYKCLNIYKESMWEGIGNCDFTSATFTGSPIHNRISVFLVHKGL